MGIKHVAIFVALLIFVSSASGQEYSIRANRGLNLRAAPSLNAEIAGTVRSGDILLVIGHNGRWLRVRRPGAEAWLANWVNFSRVEQTQTQTETAAEIDNCCFVDRQCATDQQWIDGYWAYQHGQCAAPAQMPAETSAQPAASETGVIDNCCFAGWQCNSDQEWTDGYWAFQHKQCGPATGSLRPSPHNGVIIEGSEAFIAQISAALDLLRRRAPRWYAYVTKGPLKIGESDWGAPDGYATDDSFYISPSAAAKPAHILAQLMVHEACHVHRSLAGLLRYETEQEQNLEEFLCDYLMSDAGTQIEFGRSIMTYSPSEVARLIRYGRLEQRTGTGKVQVTYVPGEVAQLLREGIDFFGALRAEIARANSLWR